MAHILSFGEILWDLFPEKQVIGGAPFNFAAHAKKLGADVTFVSAVGADELGEQALDCIRALGMGTDCVSRLPNRPTGYCKVTLQNGTPSYDLAPRVAYDYIPIPADAPKTADAFYFGTLASRMGDSFLSLWRMLDTVDAKEVFFDVNIRGDDWSKTFLDTMLPYTTILKFSREEAPALLDAYGITANGDICTALCAVLATQYPNLRQILVTLDKDGAFVYDTAAHTVLHAPKPQSRVVSTVGAGDSFSACYLYNLLCGADTEACLSRATALSDYVVTQLGAVPEYTEELQRKIK